MRDKEEERKSGAEKILLGAVRCGIRDLNCQLLPTEFSKKKDLKNEDCVSKQRQQPAVALP